MRTFSRLAALLSLLCAGSLSRAETPPAPLPEAQVPFFLQGVDLTIPAQDAFRSWPSKELAERPYWLPWSFLSFERAHLFSRPVLFVLTVEWTRAAERLERETLADGEVLRSVNDGYVSVRVDADRRPDIAERYRSGSWPVVALLLPDGMPMLSQNNPTGKALPIAAGYVDRNAMLFLLREGKTYHDRWLDTLKSVGKRWAEIGEEKPVPGPPVAAASDQLARWLTGNADQVSGGFGVAPKLVVPWLAEYARTRQAREGSAALAEHAASTLQKVVASRLHDRVEGGFHRIALAPGFEGIQYEKMLETNAAFVRDAVFALRGGASTELRDALRSTCRFLTDTLARPGGGFYLAQDADPSSPDGGGYWSAAERDASRRPPVDHLLLSGPSALAGAALLRAGKLLEDASLEAAGKAAVDLVLERGYTPGRGVDHVLEPAPESLRFLVTQADTSFALLDAYESTGEARYLRAAQDVADFALNNLQAAGEKALRDRLPERLSIGVLSSPRHPLESNVRLSRALLRLAAQGAGDSYRERASSLLGEFAGDLAALGVYGIEPALAVEELVSDPLLVRIEGGGAEAAGLRRAALALSHPWVVIATAQGASDAGAAAVLRWHGRSARVERAEQMQAQLARLLAEPAR